MLKYATMMLLAFIACILTTSNVDAVRVMDREMEDAREDSRQMDMEDEDSRYYYYYSYYTKPKTYSYSYYSYSYKPKTYYSYYYYHHWDMIVALAEEAAGSFMFTNTTNKCLCL